MSLIKEITLIKGDSSDIYTFSSPDFTDFSDPKWIGKYTIREKNIKGEVIHDGILSKSEEGDEFIFNLIPSVSDEIPVGKQFLTIEVENLEVQFRREIVQCVLTILQDGVDNEYGGEAGTTDPTEPDDTEGGETP